MIKHYKTLTNSIQEYTVIQPKNLADLHSWCDSKGVPREIFKDIDEVITLPKAIKVKAGNAMPSGFNAQIYDAEDFLSDKDDYEVITENGECLNLINVEDFGEPHYYLIRNGKNYGCAEMGFGRILNLLKTFDPKFVDHPVVYVFTQRYSEKVENWKEIGQFLKEKIQEHWSKCEIYSYYKNVFYGDRAELIRMIKCAAGRGEITNSKILNLLNKINFSNSYSYGEFASYLGIAPKINSGQEELKEFNKILKDYPLLASINPDKYDKHVSDYINVEK
jgi:hypothetical protein